MPAKSDAKSYAEALADELRKLPVEVSSEFTQLFLREARRVGPDSYSDLGSLLMLECLKAVRSGSRLTADDVSRLLDVVRHQLTREASRWRKRFHSLSYPEILDSGESTPQQTAEIQEETEAVQETIRKLLSGLPAREIRMLELWIEGATSAEIAIRFDMNAAAFRQWLHRLPEKLKRISRRNRK
jgi:DNA-directed RNA polymerase specialized sigma24 family protein